jgi:hypothetical protein
LQLGLCFFEQGGQGSRIGHVAKSFVRGFGVGTSVRRENECPCCEDESNQRMIVDEKVKMTQMKEIEVSR